MTELSNEELSTSTILRPPLETSGSVAIGTSKICKPPIGWGGGSSFAWLSGCVGWVGSISMALHPAESSLYSIIRNPSIFYSHFSLFLLFYQ